MHVYSTLSKSKLQKIGVQGSSTLILMQYFIGEANILLPSILPMDRVVAQHIAHG